MKYFTPLCSLLLPLPLLSQTIEPSVIASAGGGSPTLLTWTVGETAVQNIPSASNYLSQGFQQVLKENNSCALPACLKCIVIGVNEANNDNFSTEIFPNPASSNLTLLVSSSEEIPINITLTDLLGNVVYSSQASLHSGKNTLTIDLNNVSDAVYFLRFNNSEKNISSVYKVQKLK